MHLNSQLIFEKHALSFFQDGMRILEIGPDGFPSTYRKRVNGGLKLHWDTIDIFSSPNLTFKANNEYSFPIEAESYDIVLSGQVIEHVRKIWRWLPELARVCKTGGKIITIGPVNWPIHEVPVDCWRIYPEGMRALSEDAQLKVLLSVTESLEPKRFQARTLLRESIRFLLGRKLSMPLCLLDTITICQK